LREAAAAALDGKLVGKIDKAVKSSHRLAKLIDRLLDVSRIATGRLDLNVEELDLAELVRDAAERVAEAAAKAGSAIRVTSPPAVEGVWDRLRVDQALANLLDNAIRYGQGKPIDLDVEADDESIRLAVRDRGLGMSAKDVARVFGRFERAVHARHYGGLGLGLYITRQIVEAHGGTVRVSTAPGAGSTFTIELPRHCEHPATNAAIFDQPPAGARP
jgi:signal transduction histidine kinase